MPPWAAIEWARRGESWNVNASTWYPSSASVAAAEAPARPVPTTMILNLRLLAGLTNFSFSLNVSHFSASGPSGTLASSFSEPAVTPVASGESTAVLMGCSSSHGRVIDDARHDRDRERHVADHDDRRHPRRQAAAPLVET